MKQLEAVKNTCVDLYLDMPVKAYGTLDFHKFHEIDAIGYAHAKACLSTWKDQLVREKDFRVKILMEGGTISGVPGSALLQSKRTLGSRNLPRSQSFT